MTDVTAVAGQSHLPNVLRLAGGQRNVLRPGFLTMGSLSCAHTYNWVRCLAWPPSKPIKGGGGVTHARRRGRKRKKILLLSHVNTDLMHL